jgi:phosphatidylinositol alpha-1,6-mannosyltransferase
MEGTRPGASESTEPLVSVVIPSGDPSRSWMLDRIRKQIQEQDYKNLEILAVTGVSPQGEILVIFDDDSSVEDPGLIRTLVAALRSDATIGMVGASIRPPASSSGFQKRVACQFPRLSMPIPERIVDSDLPCHGCCAFPMNVFNAVGGERENLIRGLDPDLRQRIRSAGYRVVLVPPAVVFHEVPRNLKELIKTFYRNGRGSAYCQVHHPELAFDTDDEMEYRVGDIKKSFAFRIVRFFLRIARSLITLRFVRLISYTSYAFGYIPSYVSHTVAKLLESTPRPLVIMTIDYPPIEGGISTLARQLAEDLDMQNRPTTVVAPRLEEEDFFSSAGSIRIYRAPLYRWGYLRFFPIAGLALWCIVRHGARRVVAMNVGYGGVFSYLYSRIFPLRYVVLAYGFEFLKFKKASILADFYKRIYGSAEKVLAISDFTRKELESFGVGPEKIEVVYPEIDDSFRIRSEDIESISHLYGVNGKRVILSVSRLIPRKGHDILLASLVPVFHEIQDAVCLIAGKGPELGRLTALAHDLGIRERVIFPGYVSQRELRALYQIAQLFVLAPTAIEDKGDVEGFGIVFLEAAASGIPAVASRSGGIEEAVRDGETGLLVSPGDPRELAAGLLRLLRDPHLARELGENGRNRVYTLFRRGTLSGKILSFFEERPSA